MSTEESPPQRAGADPGVDDAVRTLLVLMPRLVGAAKRIPVPEELQSLELAPATCRCCRICSSMGP